MEKGGDVSLGKVGDDAWEGGSTSLQKKGEEVVKERR